MFGVLELDLHGCDRAIAKKTLDSFIASAPKTTERIVVIHGCNRGVSLQNYVRKSYSHARVKGKVLTLNQGVTELILK